jgi:hypothetical protein
MQSSTSIPLSLSADQIAEIVDSLSGSSRADNGDTRRASRMKLQGRVQIVPCSVNPSSEARAVAPLGVQVENVSARGIGIIHSKPLPSGSQFILHLGGERRTVVNVLCTVHHCKQIRPDRYRIGAEFTCPVTAVKGVSSDEELKRISQSILD